MATSGFLGGLAGSGKKSDSDNGKQVAQSESELDKVVKKAAADLKNKFGKKKPSRKSDDGE